MNSPANVKTWNSIVPTIPAHAERLSILDCVKPLRTKSRFAPNAQTMHMALHCPECNSTYPAEMGTTVHCGCGLSMHYGFEFVDAWRRDEIVPFHDCQGEYPQ